MYNSIEIDEVAQKYVKSKIANLDSGEAKRFINDWVSKPQQAKDYLSYFLKSVINDIKGKKILDFGCGSGRILTEFFRSGADIYGVDVDRDVIDIAKIWGKSEGVEPSRFKFYDGTRLPFDDGYFDYCFSTSTFEHLERPALSLKELSRVIKPGGYLFLGFPNRVWPFECHTQLMFIPWLPFSLADKICKIFKRRSLKEHWNVHFYSYFAFMRALKESRAEFEVVFPEDTAGMSVLKRIVTKTLNRFKIHHTALTMYMQLLLRKMAKTQTREPSSALPDPNFKETALSTERQRRFEFNYPAYEKIVIAKTLKIIPAEFVKFFLFSGNSQKRRYFLESLGFIPRQIRDIKEEARPVWIHCNSIGEVIAASSLIRSLKAKFNKKIILSTKNFKSEKKARELNGLDGVFFFPYEFKASIRKALRAINPQVVIIVENETCPNFLKCAKELKFPVVIASGIFLRYLHFYDYTFESKKEIFDNVEILCMQSEDDARKMAGLLERKSGICVTGNLKFNDIADSDKEQIESRYRKKLSLGEKDFVFITGSIHKGEEAILLDVFKRLAGRLDNLIMIIAPRYLDLVEAIESGASQRSLKFARISALSHSSRKKDTRLIIVDTFGELSKIYSVASLVFMGNSLIPAGLGHNFLEPLKYDKPVIFGKGMVNFREIADLFVERNACLRVENSKELEEAVMRLATDRAKREDMVSKAKNIIEENGDITAKTIDCFAHILE